MFAVALYKHWIRYAKKNNLRQIRFHDWRHTSATQMIANKIPLKNVQERLDHKDYTTTVNIYAHATKDVDKEASNLFGSFLKK